MATEDVVSPSTGAAEELPPKPEKKRLWRRVRDWCATQWASIRPGPEARKGAVWGTLAAAAISVVIGGLYLHTGFGYLFDFTFCVLIAAILIPLVALLVDLLIIIIRKLHGFATGLIVGSCTVVMMLWGPPDLGIAMAIGMGLAAGVLGASIATLFWGNFGQATLRKKILVFVLLLLSLAGSGYFVYLFAHAGSMEIVITWKTPVDSMPEKLAVPDPSAPGRDQLLALVYGVGSDIGRPEYGSNVAIKTRTVDASDFYQDFKGWKPWARK
jgi:hypothetical protein